jgi:sulfur-oxidizing protein SoxY
MRAEPEPGAGRLDAMRHERRTVLRQGLFAALAAGGLLQSGQAVAAGEEIAFGATSMQEALAALGGTSAAGAEIILVVPDASENGAVVPVSVDCNLPGTSEIFIVVESNPNPLVVRFTIPEGTQPCISTRIKIAESGKVYAVARTEGRLVSACKHTQVTVGGCG